MHSFMKRNRKLAASLLVFSLLLTSVGGGMTALADGPLPVTWVEEGSTLTSYDSYTAINENPALLFNRYSSTSGETVGEINVVNPDGGNEMPFSASVQGGGSSDTSNLMGYDDEGRGIIDPNSFLPSSEGVVGTMGGDSSSGADFSTAVAPYEAGELNDFYNLHGERTSVASEDPVPGEEFKVAAVGAYCTVWVPTAADATNVLTEEQAKTLAAEFDAHFDDMKTAFGDFLDADRDGKVALLCYDIKSPKEQGGSYIAGYFWSDDMYNEIIDTSDVEYKSNGMDIIHIDTNQGMSDGNIESVYSTVIHEFQHLINASYIYSHDDNKFMDTMPTFLNEAFSMAAEHMIYGASSMTSRINHYNSSDTIASGDASLTAWDERTTGNNVLDNYALSYLFGQYISIQDGRKEKLYPATAPFYTTDFYKTILAELPIGASEAETCEYLAEQLGFESFIELMEAFYMANLLKESTGIYGYKNESWANSISTQAPTTPTDLLPGAAMYFFTYAADTVGTDAGANISFHAAKYNVQLDTANAPTTFTATEQEWVPDDSLGLTSSDYSVSYALPATEYAGELQNGKPFGAGAYNVTLSPSGNFSGNPFVMNGYLAKAAVTVTPEGVSITYGDPLPDSDSLSYGLNLTHDTMDLRNYLWENVNGALAYEPNIGETPSAGIHDIVQGTLSADSFYITVDGTGKFTVNQRDVTATIPTTNIVVFDNVEEGAQSQTDGSFIQPMFYDTVTKEPITGELKYSYNGDSDLAYDTLEDKLAELGKDATGTITYTFTATGNYKGTISGTMNFVVKGSALYFVDENGKNVEEVQIKPNPTVHDTWADILAVNPDLIASSGFNAPPTQGEFDFIVDNGATSPSDGGDKYYPYVLNFTPTGGTPVTAISGTVYVNKVDVTATPTAPSITEGEPYPDVTIDYKGLAEGLTVTASTDPTFEFVDIDGSLNKTIVWTNKETIVRTTITDTDDNNLSYNYTLIPTDGLLTVNEYIAPPPVTGGGGGAIEGLEPELPEGVELESSDDVTTATVATEPTVTGTGASATVDDETFKAALDAAAEAAGTGDEIKVVIAVGDTGDADTVDTTINTGSLTTFRNSDATELVIESDMGEITLSEAAVTSIATQATGANVTLSIGYADPEDMNEAQRKRAGNNPVYDINILSDGVKISEFGGETLEITLPFTPTEPLTDGEVVKVYYLNDDGNLIDMKATYDAVSGTVTFVTDHLSLFMISVESVQSPFTDVTDADWFYSEVLYAYNKDLMTGVSDTLFAPNDNMTRAMVWTVLARIDGVDTAGADPWYSAAMAWAIEDGVSDGTNPDGTITREEFATMLYRFAGSPTVDGMLNYPDDDMVSDWAYEALIWAVDQGIIGGMDDGTLNPQGKATRAQMATMLMRYLEI